MVSLSDIPATIPIIYYNDVFSLSFLILLTLKDWEATRYEPDHLVTIVSRVVERVSRFSYSTPKGLRKINRTNSPENTSERLKS